MVTCRDSGFARTLDEGTITNKQRFQSCDRSEKYTYPHLIPLSTVNPAEFSLKIKTLGRVASRSKVWVPFFLIMPLVQTLFPGHQDMEFSFKILCLSNHIPLASRQVKLQLGYSGEPLPDISGLIEVEPSVQRLDAPGVLEVRKGNKPFLNPS